MARRFAAALAALVFCGCPAPVLPGDQPMGTWAMTATVANRGPACELAELQPQTDGGVTDFSFRGVLTRQSTTTEAWLTLAGYSREGTFDGQYFATSSEADRVFSDRDCSECQTKLVEDIYVAVLSRTQAEALGGRCPDVIDGGVPVPDGGVLPPGQTMQGFDAVRLCGSLTTSVVGTGTADGGACAPKCSGCLIEYQLRGERR